ncbi:class I SAM-dependent methyltransferase [Caenispirillum salinarum]|uniref:class I SAM-dependent methyltransferase n=1 Tax=Caenispirillum salinarum TaxID=859058 RepID=UPI00384B6F1F
MESTTYAAEAEAEARHWWFVGRRRLFGREISRLCVGADATILDVGTSTGTNLRLLRDSGFQNVTGVDMSSDAIRYCAEKNLGVVRQADVRDMPFGDCSFDLVMATDIVEHVDDDEAALREIFRVTRPGGHVLFTVPAFQSLWGLQDRVSHHKRRYLREPFNRMVATAGFSVTRTYYFNFLLFAPIWVARRLIDATAMPVKSENHLSGGVFNSILGAIFDADCLVAPSLRPPFGVSLLSVAQRPRL